MIFFCTEKSRAANLGGREFQRTEYLTKIFKRSGGLTDHTGGNNPPVGGNNVSIYNMAFSAAPITVKAGTTVKWTNNDDMAHTVTADNNSFDSGNIAPGGTDSRTLNAAGTIAYHCTIHTTMKGSVVVN